MSHSLGYGTSSGDLNTGGNLSESSFLEALFGLEFDHADSQMTQIFLLCCLLVPQISQNSTDFSCFNFFPFHLFPPFSNRQKKEDFIILPK